MRTKSLLLASAAVMCFSLVGFGEEVNKETGKKDADKLTTYNIHMSGVS